MAPKRIGEFLIERKVLNPLEVEQILDYGKREKLRFGEAGIKLGLLTESELARVFGKNYRVDYFHLDPQYFPKETSELLDLKTILRYGVLPLGQKKEYGFFRQEKILNLGMLDPGREKEISLEAFPRRRIFLVLAEQFLDVLQSCYGLSANQVALMGAEELDPTLRMFLGERL